MTSFLVVDDSPSIRLTLQGALAKLHPGCEILTASTPAEAIERFRQGKPDLVFLDMMLIGRSGGLDVLGTILDRSPEAKVVLSTSLPPGHPDVVDAIARGATAFLPKPVRAEHLRKLLEELRYDAEFEWRSHLV